MILDEKNKSIFNERILYRGVQVEVSPNIDYYHTGVSELYCLHNK